MQNYGAAQMAASWRTVRKNTIQIAEEIPADRYSFQATPDTMTVTTMLAHLATSTHWAEQMHCVEQLHTVQGSDFHRLFSEAGAMTADLTTKATIVDALIAR